MTVDKQVVLIRRQLRKRTARTAAELAECAGFNSGREITLALKRLVEGGEAVKDAGRIPVYTKV